MRHRETLGLSDDPSKESRKYGEGRPAGRRKHPLSSQENFTGQFRKPAPSPSPSPVDNGSLYFLPSLPQPPPHTAVVPERVGNTGHTTGTLWTLWADLCPQAQREGSCQGVTSGMSSIPQPCPTHLEELERGFQFLDGDPEAPRTCRCVQVTTSAFSSTPSLEPSSLEMGTQEPKGLSLRAVYLLQSRI